MPKIIYWISTGFVCALMLFSATMYFIANDMVQETFTTLGFPTYIIYPLAIAKILAVVAILTKKSQTLKEWAYAGLFYDFLLAFSGHIMAQDGEFAGAAVAMVALCVSYAYDRKLFPAQKAQEVTA